MILAIDIGNTHMVLGCLNEANEVCTRFQMSTDRYETSYEYAAEIKQILALEEICAADLEGAIISSVVPSVTVAVQKAVILLSQKEPLLLGSNVRIDLALDMNGLPAEAIAGDLLATSIAAKAYYPMPSIVVDIGTATTVTALNKDGVYIGGCILPGPGTAMKGLVEHTALLPAVNFDAPEKAIAKDTVHAMQSGIMYGSAGALDGILDRFAEEIPDPVQTILVTGGMATKIGPLFRHEIVIDQELLLKGLGLIWRQNQRKR